MKRTVALISAIILIFSLASCTNRGKVNEKTESENTDAVTTDKQYQSYEDLEYKSDDRFTLEEILTFNSKSGDYLVEEGSIFYVDSSKNGGSISFDDLSTVKEYTDVTAPFGVNVGEPVEELEKGFSLDTGYAVYVKKGGAFQTYYSDKEMDITDGQGGSLFFGYAMDGTGKWAFMDEVMLKAVISKQLVIQGAGDTYNIVLYSCVVDDDLNVSHISVLYGEVNHVMAMT